MKERLDKRLVSLGLCRTREQAQARIMAGEVWSQERRLEKPGIQVPLDLTIEIRSRKSAFVGRGGEKLAHALKHFSVSAENRVCLDIGASTGGFTDCLLKNGAALVFAVDVGKDQLDDSLRDHSKVVRLEKTNARYLTREKLHAENALADQISLLTIDVSFISVLKIIPALTKLIPLPKSDWIILFKPQFEVGVEHVKKGGRIRDETVIESAFSAFDSNMNSLGLHRNAQPENSPIRGKKSGNLERLVHYEFIQENK